MEVHTLEPSQRRMLLEMLVGERTGESSLQLGPVFGREVTAEQLCRLRLAVWVTSNQITFTAVGRGVAEVLADRLGRPVAASAC